MLRYPTGPASGMTVLRGLDASMQLLPSQDTTSDVALRPRLPPLIANTSFCALALQALH